MTRGGLGDAVERRKRWISEIGGCSGDFGEDVARLEDDLAKERKLAGLQAIIDHLRLCDAIPESYGYNRAKKSCIGSILTRWWRSRSEPWGCRAPC